MDVLFLSRLQFAAATYFHFLFVPLTLGLSLLIAIMETIFVSKKNEIYRQMAKFWGKLFLINFAIGVVTGLTLEFQFGTNWSKYSKFVGDIFGSLLAMEATMAFFLESTFIAVWAFGWKKLSPRMHCFSIWLVSCASSISAIWILIANSWMQHPVGYVIRNGRAELTDFIAVITQKFAIMAIMHTLFAGYILSGFYVMGVSAYHILKRNNIDFFNNSFRIAAIFSLIFSVGEIIEGHFHGLEIAETQPLKLAAMESHWETAKPASMSLWLIPNQKMERNDFEFGTIPGLLSLLAKNSINAEVKGLKDFPKELRPPVILPFLGFRTMVGLGFFFAFLSVTCFVFKERLESNKWLLRILLFVIPLPYIAILAGWTVTEVGRQPWIVYGIMKTSEAVSQVAESQVLTSLIFMTLLYTVIGVVGFYLMFKIARQGPAILKSSENQIKRRNR